MPINPLAGHHATADMLIDVAKLDRAYYDRKPDLSDTKQLVSFGTSGHRGTPNDGTFTEAHILAISQAIVDYRKSAGIDGPLFMGKDTHALSAARRSNGPAGSFRRERQSKPSSPKTTAQLQRPSSPGRSSTHNHGKKTGWRMGSSSRHPTIPPATEDSNTTRPTAAPPTPMSPTGFRTAPTH